MKEITKIKLIFENLETCNINANEIGFIGISGIHENISRIASNSIANLKVAKHVFIEILKDKGLRENSEEDTVYSYTSLYERINFNDITSIELYYKDGTIDEIYPKYKETPHFSNKNQNTKIESNNHLYITISEKYKSFRDKFGEDYDIYIAN